MGAEMRSTPQQTSSRKAAIMAEREKQSFSKGGAVEEMGPGDGHFNGL